MQEMHKRTQSKEDGRGKEGKQEVNEGVLGESMKRLSAGMKQQQTSDLRCPVDG